MNSRYLLAGAGLVLFIVFAVFALRQLHPMGALAPAHAPAIKTKGPSNAPVELVEYSDFQCPACRSAQEGLKKILQEYPNQVRLVFRHFPLSGHKWSALAHQAAECANPSGHFWDFHDRLYAEQPVWSVQADPTETFLTYAKDSGLNLDSFAACLTDPSVRNRIEEERARGDSLKVSSTPTFFINGERLVGPAELQTRGEEMIRRELRLPPKPSPPAAQAAVAKQG